MLAVQCVSLTTGANVTNLDIIIMLLSAIFLLLLLGRTVFLISVAVVTILAFAYMPQDGFSGKVNSYLHQRK
jgi:hypothetical protein